MDRKWMKKHLLIQPLLMTMAAIPVLLDDKAITLLQSVSLLHIVTNKKAKLTRHCTICQN